MVIQPFSYPTTHLCRHDHPLQTNNSSRDQCHVMEKIIGDEVQLQMSQLIVHPWKVTWHWKIPSIFTGKKIHLHIHGRWMFPACLPLLFGGGVSFCGESSMPLGHAPMYHIYHPKAPIRPNRWTNKGVIIWNQPKQVTTVDGNQKSGIHSPADMVKISKKY